jgi:hypothetical protein
VETPRERGLPRSLEEEALPSHPVGRSNTGRFGFSRVISVHRLRQRAVREDESRVVIEAGT